MVSIAPNQFYIEGEIVSKKKAESIGGFATIVVQVKNIRQLNGPAQFLDPDTKELSIRVAEQFAEDLKKGMHIQCKVRKAPGHYFIIPDSIDTSDEKKGTGD